MHRELITEKDLRGQLREQGIEDITRIKNAAIESDGRISVIPFDESSHSKSERKAK